MSKTIIKNIVTFEVLNIINWMESENGFLIKNELPIKVQWGMRNNLKAFDEVRMKYNEFVDKLHRKYSDDKYSEISTSENGQEIRVVKAEYIADYNKEMDEIYATENEIKLEQFSLEDFGDADITLRDMDILSIFIKNNDENEDKTEKENVEA
jgi:hypothetical protein